MKGAENMDISNISTVSAAINSLNNSSLPEDIGVALTKKALDTNNGNSQSLIKMMDNLNPNLGKNINTKA
jgi:hypothetical protein